MNKQGGNYEFCARCNYYKKEMRIRLYSTGVFLVMASWAMAFPSDSTKRASPKKKGTSSVVVRTHTLGLFFYMGKVANYHPTADVSFTYTGSGGWGLFVFKVADIKDIHSHNNFTFALLSKAIHLGSHFTITPNIGVALEQQHAFADHGSDVLAMLTSSFRFNKNLVADQTAMFTNLIFEPVYSDWINRFRLLYSKGHLDMTGFLWLNNGLIDGIHYTSTGISIFYNRIPLGKRVWLGGGATGLLVSRRLSTDVVPINNGVQFTASLTIK